MVKKASVSLTTIAPAQEGVVTFNGTKYKLGLDVKHTPPVGTPNVGDPAGIGLEYRGNVGWDANNPTNTITIKWGGIGPEGPIFPNFEYERGDGTKAEAGPIRSANFGAEYSIEPKEEE